MQSLVDWFTDTRELCARIPEVRAGLGVAVPVHEVMVARSGELVADASAGDNTLVRFGEMGAAGAIAGQWDLSEHRCGGGVGARPFEGR